MLHATCGVYTVYVHVGYINNIETNHVHVTCYMWGYINSIHPIDTYHIHVTCYMWGIYCICTCGVYK